ncbi:MAG: Slp family lipoprotein [Deltaproteobacteria bacterium]|nr:Slp family lipoprotein [Deltaproteobacteria bacterium]MBW1953195.1 Slp family lipoprotein [Deltaproteobacteria bacterium]MBW1985981.1 Slp family lipoprotein [Deltaproteobacteria bacterium]MBW2134857.1 Slp family lipoprotein [Deltaproteobacteria bacterium]
MASPSIGQAHPNRNGPKIFGLILLFGLAAGCAPVFSQAMLDQVDRDLSFTAVAADPETYLGKTVLWGGVINQTRPKEGKTELEIVQKNLDRRHRPEDGDTSLGRFLVEYAGFLDPAIYKAGREITVVGEVKGSEVRKLGETDYRYPLIAALSLHLWPQPIPYERYPYYWGPPYPYYYWGPYYWRHPWFWP